MNEPLSVSSRLVVALVSLYIVMVGLWLRLSKQIPSPGFTRIAFRLACRPFAGEIGAFQPESGHCFLASLPPDLLSDQDSSSALQVFEDGRPLGPAHAAHADIRTHGHGRYSHWGEQLYFSTSDNSDPRTNGRRYSVREVR